jgi:hypothetical protein
LYLQTIWKFDSFDWAVRTVVRNATVTWIDVDADYGLFINNLSAGTFDAVEGIMLTHELNNFAMQEKSTGIHGSRRRFGTMHSFVNVMT